MSETSKKQQLGCLVCILAMPGMILWLVLVWRILTILQATTADWCMFVGYVAATLTSFAAASVYRVVSE